MMRINGKTKTLGLIGCPVEHTMSPFIHNLLAKYMDINVVYIPFYVKKGDLASAISGAKALNILGNNITVPYKVDAIEFVDTLDQRAKIIEAVNTLKYFNNTVFGYNTDADGFLISCTNAGINFKDKTICILGAGGASKAVTLICAEKAAKKIIIVNRTIEKALLLKKSIQNHIDIDIDIMNYNNLLKLNEIDICIQTTSVGMYPNVSDCLIIDKTIFNKMEWAVDLIYNPKETKFLKLAKENKVKTLNGLGMLYFQAVKAFEIWNEVTIPQSIIQECYQQFYDYMYSR